MEPSTLAHGDAAAASGATRPGPCESHFCSSLCQRQNPCCGRQASCRGRSELRCGGGGVCYNIALKPLRVWQALVSQTTETRAPELRRAAEPGSEVETRSTMRPRPLCLPTPLRGGAAAPSPRGGAGRLLAGVPGEIKSPAHAPPPKAGRSLPPQRSGQTPVLLGRCRVPFKRRPQRFRVRPPPGARWGSGQSSTPPAAPVLALSLQIAGRTG